MFDPFASRVERLLAVVLDGPGSLGPAVRRSLAEGGPAPTDGGQASGPLTHYAATVRDSAYLVTDDDVSSLMESGLAEGEIFEATISAALGAAHHRLEAGLRALRDAGV